MTHRYPYDGDAVRRAILALAVPGRLLPPQAAIARLIHTSQSNVAWHLERLRDDWRLVTRPVTAQASSRRRGNRRLLVVDVP